MRREWAMLAVATFAGCYNPTIRAGAPCTTDHDCPSTLTCVESVCGGTESDAAMVLDASLDSQADAAIDAMHTVYILGDDATELRDAEIWGSNPNVNYGAVNHISVDADESPLLWFDLTSIPSSKTVVSATLNVTVADAASEDNGTVTIHRLREAWVESEATWLSRASLQGWSVSGARSPSSDTTAVASFMPAALNTSYDVTLPAALVQEWVADPSINFGIMIVRGTSLEHVHLESRESGVWSRLTVDAY